MTSLGLIFSPSFLPPTTFFQKVVGGLVNASTFQSSVSVIVQYNLYQEDFRFFSPTNTFCPNDAWPPGDYDLPMNSGIDIATFPLQRGDIIRLKTSLVANSSIPGGAVRFKLQFKPKGAGCDTNETWYDVGGEGSNSAWRGFDIPDLADDDWITDDPTMPDSDMSGGYNEFGETDWNPNIIPEGQRIEYDWVIQNHLAEYGETYCFRMIQFDSAGQTITLPGYNNYIEIETPPQYIGFENKTMDHTTGDSFYLTNPDNTQFFVEAPENYGTAARDFKMYSFNKDDLISSIPPPSGRYPIGDYIYQMQSQKDNFFYHHFDASVTISISYEEEDISGYNEDSLEIRRWNGQEWLALSSTVDEDNNLVSATITEFSFFELFGEEEEEEEAVCGNGVIEDGEVCDDGIHNGQYGYCQTDCSGLGPYCGNSSLDSDYEECDDGNTTSGDGCSATCENEVPPPPSGGGGGGGYVWPSVTKVIVKGRAYPEADITLLSDGKVEAAAKADSLGNFNFEITEITAGIYTFSLWAIDKAGRKSITFSFTTNIVKNSTTTISGIFLPPTIELSKVKLQKGETLDILGQTAPESEITISVESSEIIKNTTATKEGDWDYSFDTVILEDGSHTTRAKAKSPEGLLSSFSQVLAFYIGEGTAGLIKPADSNNDAKVNLVDFSILLYNWGVPKNPAADLNSDGRVNLVDFSIMLYHWTG